MPKKHFRARMTPTPGFGQNMTCYFEIWAGAMEFLLIKVNDMLNQGLAWGILRALLNTKRAHPSFFF